MWMHNCSSNSIVVTFFGHVCFRSRKSTPIFEVENQRRFSTPCVFSLTRDCSIARSNSKYTDLYVVISDIPTQSEVAAVQCVFSRRLNIGCCCCCCITDIWPMPYLRQRPVYSAPATFLCDSVTLIFATIIIIIITIYFRHEKRIAQIQKQHRNTLRKYKELNYNG